jgi:hypothetical protein
MTSVVPIQSKASVALAIAVRFSNSATNKNYPSSPYRLKAHLSGLKPQRFSLRVARVNSCPSRLAKATSIDDEIWNASAGGLPAFYLGCTTVTFANHHAALLLKLANHRDAVFSIEEHC